jgi:hypothetical protein
MTDLDPRDGIHTVWITASSGNQVLSTEALALFAGSAAAAARATIRVSHREDVRCISIRGDREQRNAALVFLGDAFYAAGHKWIRTTENFDWLKQELKRA